MVVIRVVGRMLNRSKERTVRPQVNFIQDQATAYKKQLEKAKKREMIQPLEPDSYIRIGWNSLVISIYFSSIVLGSFQLGFTQLSQIQLF